MREQSNQSRSANWDIAKGNWKQFKGRIKERWGDLTDDNLDRIEGNRDKLLGAIQETYGKSRKEAEEELSRWEQDTRFSDSDLPGRDRLN
ncbi:MAG TPA: CsbD family protein [Gammaproteobacteria bacterium]|nr:CsbD family protein [Gammaproteobacteria bacterium]